MMMIKISNKGASDFLRRAIINYLIFFIFLGIIISFGAGRFITSDTILEPPVPEPPSGDWFTDLVQGISWPINQLTYFINLMTHSVNLQIFTGIVMVPFLVIVIMFVIETVRGH